MADNNQIQLPQDLMKIDITLDYNPDLLRKTISDMLIKIGELEDRIVELESV